MTAPPATSLEKERGLVNHIIALPNINVEGDIHTKDHQSQVQRIHPAFHMQFHKDSERRSHSFEEISPDIEKVWLWQNQQHQLSPIDSMVSPSFTLKSKLLILSVEASTVSLSRFVPACSFRRGKNT